MADRVVVVLHGVHSGKRKSAWMPLLCADVERLVPRAVAVPFYYGWTSAFMVGFPVVARLVRRRLVRRFQAFVARQLRSLGPTWALDCVAHSFGTWIAFRSMTQEGGVRPFFDRVVFMGGCVSSREEFRTERGHFGKLLNLYSRGDDVIRLTPLGQCGYRGFVNAPPHEVVNMDVTPANHDSHTEPGQSWNLALRFLGDVR